MTRQVECEICDAMIGVPDDHTWDWCYCVACSGDDEPWPLEQWVLPPEEAP